MKKQEGYSLVELSVVLIIVGLIFALLYQYYPRTQAVQKQVVKSFNTENIDNVITGFAYSHGRLPFPDNDKDGIENIGAVTGTIPEKTLGLAEKPVNQVNIPLTYSIFRKPDLADSTLDADLAISKDRLYALLPSGTRVAALTPLLQSNTIDLCFALKTAANIRSTGNVQITDTTSLHVSKSGSNKNVAYVLVDVGSENADNDAAGKLLDGFNAIATGIKFESPTRPRTQNYDDQVNTKEFSELFGALGCGSVISAALHAHDNVVLAADMMHTSFEDYSRLLALSKDLADAGELLAIAAVAQGVAGLADALSAAAIAAAETFTTPFEAFGVAAAALAATAIGLGAASTAAAALSLKTAEDAVEAVENAQECFDSGTGPICGINQPGDFVDEMAALTITILANATTADAAGL